MTAAQPLAQDFPSADESAWRELAVKTLKGGDFDKRLVSRTADGIPVQPLYPPAGQAAAPRRATGDQTRPWDLRTATRNPDPAGANAELLEDLNGGAASVLVQVDPSGGAGVAIADSAGLARVLDGVLLDLAPVALDAGFLGPVMADALAELCPTGAAPAFHLDPISAFASSGESPGPLESHVIAAATTAMRLRQALPEASLFLASGRVVHEAGGGEAQELGFAVASALAYAKAQVRAGSTVEAALPRIVLGLSADADYFVTLSKLRAARAVWARLAAASGAPNVAARIEVRSSRRMLAAVDPWVNLLRLTAAGFGAATGGADSIVLGSFTDAIGLPTAFARRQARNTQLVLMEEAHVGRVADPAGGSGYVETLTQNIARAAWGVLQAIERQGGVLGALEHGGFQAQVRATAEQRRKAFATRRSGLVGVSEFPNLSEADVAVLTPTAASASAPDVRRPGPDGRCEPLTPLRWAEPFEALRGRAAGARAFVALLGPAAEHGARLGFVNNLLGAGGVGIDAGALDGFDGRPVAVLAGSDERYAAEAAEAARTLKGRGARLVLLAGRPGELEPSLREAGVDGFVYAGGEALADLERIHAALGADAGR